jgi:hypothetical protein
MSQNNNNNNNINNNNGFGISFIKQDYDKYDKDENVIWFKEGRENGYQWLSNSALLVYARDRSEDEKQGIVSYYSVDHFIESQKFKFIPENLPNNSK